MTDIAITPLNRAGYRVGRVAALSLVVIAVVWLVSIRVPTAIWFGSFTLNAYLTGIAALIAGVLLAYTVVLFALKRPPLGVGLAALPRQMIVASLSALPFLVYSLVSLGLNFRIEGFQNALVWAAFALSLCALPYWFTSHDQRRIGQILTIVVVAVPTTKIVSFFGGFDFYGEASYALVAVVLLAYAVAQTPRRWFDYLTPWLLLVSILLCDVRTAAVVAGLLMVVTVTHLPLRALAKGAIATGIAIAAGGLVWLFVGDRLANSGDGGLAQFVGEDSPLAGIGTTNRAAAWAFILENLPPETNWWGQGAGHSSYLADELLGIHHPHNEYIRIFFDFGWEGLGLFLIGSAVLFGTLVVNWRGQRGDLALGSVLVIPAVALLAVTDNPIVFVYVMVPVAVLVAASWGHRANATRPTVVRKSLPGA